MEAGLNQVLRRAAPRRLSGSPASPSLSGHGGLPRLKS